MIQNAELKKAPRKKTVLKPLLLILLGLIVLLIAAAAGLYIYSKAAKTTRDDVTDILSTEAMTAAERYSFDASALEMYVSIDKSDLWWLLKESDQEDIIGDIRDELESLGMTLQSYGLDITDKGILISAEITYGDFIRLPLKLLTSMSVKDGTLTISPSGVYLGKIRLPIEKLPLSRLTSGFGMRPDFSFEDYKYDISLSGLGPVTMLTDISLEDNRMVMAYKLDESLFSHSISAFGSNLDWYAGECIDCIEVLREYCEEGALGERFKSLIEGFSSNPDSFSRFVAETLAVAPGPVSKEYLYKNESWLTRFMPEITDESISHLHDSLYNLCAERSALFDSLMETLQASYNARKFGVSEKGFTYNNKPFDLKNYLGSDFEKYSGWLDDSSFRLVLIDTVNAYDAKTPSLRKITNSADYIDYVDTLNDKFPIGFIVKMKDGTPVLKYYSIFIVEGEKTEITNRTVLLDNAKYESMMKNPLVPVWRD